MEAAKPGISVGLDDETSMYASDTCMAYIRTALSQLRESSSPSTSTVTSPPHVGWRTMTSKPWIRFAVTSRATHCLRSVTVSSALSVCASSCRLPRWSASICARMTSNSL